MKFFFFFDGGRIPPFLFLHFFMSMGNGLLRNTTKVGVVRLDWLDVDTAWVGGTLYNRTMEQLNH